MTTTQNGTPLRAVSDTHDERLTLNLAQRDMLDTAVALTDVVLDRTPDTKPRCLKLALAIDGLRGAISELKDEAGS